MSEAAASLKRISSGATRLERMPSGQQRLVAASSPMPPSPLYASSSGRHSTGDLPRGDPQRVQPRYSDPGVWTQQYQGFFREGGRRATDPFGASSLLCALWAALPQAAASVLHLNMLAILSGNQCLSPS